GRRWARGLSAYTRNERSGRDHRRLSTSAGDGVLPFSGISADGPAARYDAGEYVDALLKVGLLRWAPLVADQDPDWDLQLGQYLERVNDEHAAMIVAL